MRITVEPQPREFIGAQPPAIRKALRAAIHALENDEISPEPLEDELEGFYKVRVERIRLILQSAASESGPFFRIVFAERRKVVYELFSQILGLD